MRVGRWGKDLDTTQLSPLSASLSGVFPLRKVVTLISFVLSHTVSLVDHVPCAGGQRRPLIQGNSGKSMGPRLKPHSPHSCIRVKVMSSAPPASCPCLLLQDTGGRWRVACYPPKALGNPFGDGGSKQDRVRHGKNVGMSCCSGWRGPPHCPMQPTLSQVLEAESSQSSPTFSQQPPDMFFSASILHLSSSITDD